jgi:hypothetical protein
MGFMATIGQLVRTIADVSGIEESSVKLIARYAREAGYIGQQSTGAGAAKMTAADAANLLIGLNATELAKDVPLVVPVYRSSSNILSPEGVDVSAFFSDVLQFGQSFGAALEALIAACLPEQDSTTRLEKELDALRPTPDSIVGISISFDRPFPIVSIRLNRLPLTSEFDVFNPPSIQEIISTSFWGTFPDKKKKVADRTITTSITQNTLLRIGQVLAN